MREGSTTTAAKTTTGMRAPGQHLAERVRDEYLLPMAMRIGFGAGVVSLALMVLVAWFAFREWVPWIASFGTLAAGIWATLWVNKHEARAILNMRGVRGEREVGAVLADLGRLGYIARHDIQCEKDGRRWNIDHLLIGPSGVYVVETKWRAKAAKGNRIAFDGERVRVGDGPWDAEPIRQVRANADWVRQRLAGAGMADVPVRGMVCYPGWWVDEVGPVSDVVVINPKQVFGRVEGMEKVMDGRRVREVGEVV